MTDPRPPAQDGEAVQLAFGVFDELVRSSTKKPVGRRRGSYGPKARAIRQAVLGFTDEYDVMTVRQAFYQCSTRGYVEKTEKGGYRPVQDQILRMRREGVLPWEFIADGTRWMRKPSSYDSVEDAIASMHRSYRRNLWQSQGCRVEIWLEKDALAGVISDVTSRWDVPLMVSRGTSSETFLYSAGRAARAACQAGSAATTFVYALYDFDGYGETAARKVEAGLLRYSDILAPETRERWQTDGAPELRALADSIAPTIEFSLLALDWQQIIDLGLPKRPIGERKDGQAKRPHSDAHLIGGGAVELDAIPPDVLCRLVEDAILSHVDEDAWRKEQLVEESERQMLTQLVGGET